MDDIDEDLTSLGLMLRGTIDLTKDEGQWRLFICTRCRQMTDDDAGTDLFALGVVLC